MMEYGKQHTDGSRSGGQKPEPKLLTEADARKLRNLPRDEYVAELRERGLIAPEPEPVDPLLIEAREIVARIVGAGGASWFGGEFRKGKCDDHQSMKVALAALRRGMELRPELTRDSVRDAVERTSLDYFLRAQDGDHPDALGMRIDRLYAALTRQVQP